MIYKKLCQLEENEEMSIEAKLERLKIYGIEINRIPPNYTIKKSMMTCCASFKKINQWENFLL